MSGIERSAEQNLERILGLEPIENDPYANVTLDQALDDAYLALHSPSGVTPNQYAETKAQHSKRVLGVLDSFSRRVIFEGYRANRDKVHPDFSGSPSFGLNTSEIFSGISVRKEGDRLTSSITFAKYRPNWHSWEFRLDMKYDSEHEYQIGGDTFQNLEVDYLKPAGPGEVPVDQTWKVVINDGAITYMEKSFGTYIDPTEEEPDDKEDRDDGDDGGDSDSSLPPGPIDGIEVQFERQNKIPINRTND